MRTKLLVPVGLAVVLFLSFYMLYDTRTEVIRTYNSYVSAARECAEQGLQVDAIQNYRQALSVKDTPELYIEAGEVLYKLENVTGAVSWGEEVVEKYPDEPKGYEFLLKLYLGNSDYSSCFSLYDTISKKEIATKEIENMMKEIEYVYFMGSSFEDVSTYSNGYCAVMTDGKWGMVNEKGGRVVPCQYASVGYFLSDVAPVKTEDGEVFYIDAEGNKKIVIQGVDSIVELSPLFSEIFSVYDGQSWTYYNRDFEKISDSYDSVSLMGNQVAAVERAGIYQLLDASMEKLNDKTYMEVVKDQRGVVYRNEALFVREDLTYSMIDKEGKRRTNTEYKNARLFNDQTYAAVENEKGWFFIDNEGKEIFENQYFEDAHSFLNGFAAVKLDGLWGFLDMEGNLAIPCMFEDVKDFNTSGAVFVYTEDSWQLLRLYSHNH